MMKEGLPAPKKRKQTLPKRARLHLRKEIDALFHKGQVSHRKLLRLHYRVCKGLAEDQFLVVVGKKYCPKAVLRNWVRRRIKEAYRLQCSHFKSRSRFYRLAFIYQGRLGNEPLPTYAALAREVKELLQTVPR